MHVLFAYVGDVTGSSRALRQIRTLRGARIGVTVVAALPPASALRAPDALPVGVRHVTAPVPPARGPAYFLAAHRAVATAAADVLRSASADVLHASDLYVLPALARLARAQGAALVYDSREWYAGLDASAGRPWVSRVWAAVEARYAPRADAVLTVNDAIADRLHAERRLRARPAVLPNVSDLAPHPRTGALRTRLGLDDRTPLVLYQGLFRAGRGLPTLVEAAARVPEAALVLIGEGDQEAEMRALAGRVLPTRAHWLPFTPPDALAALTPDADVGVALIEPRTESLRLALPNKLFEYARADVPVLAGRGVVPLVEAVETSGGGRVADPADPADVAAHLRAMLTDDAARAQMRDGLARLRARFDPADAAARLLAVYEGLPRRTRTPRPAR